MLVKEKPRCDICGEIKHDSYFYTLVIYRHEDQTDPVKIHLCADCFMKKLGSTIPKYSPIRK